MTASWDPLEWDEPAPEERTEHIRRVLSRHVAEVRGEAPFEPRYPVSAPAMNRKVLCGACLRRLDAWPDGRYTHKNGQIDVPSFVDHHEAIPKEAI